MTASTKPTFTNDLNQAEAGTDATPTITGWSSTTIKTMRYFRMGKIVVLSFWVTGTSNATTATLTLPFAAQTANTSILYSGMLDNNTDNGTPGTTPGKALIDTQLTPTVVTFYRLTDSTPWTASGTKGVRGTIIYEAA